MSTKLMPATTGTRAFGVAPVGSWLSGDLSRPGCYQLALQAPNHLQIAGVVPATGVVSARPFAGSAVNGTDAARKRGRPPRGEAR